MREAPASVDRPRQHDAGRVTGQIGRHEVVAQDEGNARLPAERVQPGRVRELAEFDRERDRQRDRRKGRARRRRPDQPQHEEHGRRPQRVACIFGNDERQDVSIQPRREPERDGDGEQDDGPSLHSLRPPACSSSYNIAACRAT